jgi:hypothetical protein
VGIEKVQQGWQAGASALLRASQLRSPMTWWLMGIMHRANGSLGEAIKSYRNALRLEPENTNALRDLASAQCHTLDFVGAAETRGVLLKARPTPLHMAGLADSSQPPLLPAQPPGQPPPGDPLPRRAQLLHAIAQCNAFATALPAEDSPWKRALLWPLLARLQSMADRERMFDERAPLSYLSAYFVLGSLFNHSCAPTVAYSRCAWEEGQEAPRMRFVAARGIARGEEAVHSYIESSAGAEARRKKLLLTYRFRCGCSRCVEEVGALAAGGSGDPLAPHFPHGLGAEGIANYYARGGRYPSETLEHPEEE